VQVTLDLPIARSLPERGQKGVVSKGVLFRSALFTRLLRKTFGGVEGKNPRVAES
jgi:hypothetical protein